MIAHETIQKFFLYEIIFILLTGGIIGSIILVSTLIIPSHYMFFITLSTLVIGSNISRYIVNKPGTVLAIYLLVGILTILVFDIGIIGYKKIIVYSIIGILFETFSLFFAVQVHSLPIDIILGTTLSLTILPLITAILLSPSLASSFPLGLINIMILSFSIGLGLSTLTFFIWRYIERKKHVIELEAYMGVQ